MARLSRYRGLYQAFRFIRPGYVAEIYPRGESHVDGPVFFQAKRRRGQIVLGSVLSLRREVPPRRAVLKVFQMGDAIPETALLYLPPTVAVEGVGGARYALQFFTRRLPPRAYAKYLATVLATAVHTGHLAADLGPDNAPIDIWLERPPNGDPILDTIRDIDYVISQARRRGEVLRYLRQFLSDDRTWDLSYLRRMILRTRASLAAMGYRLKPFDVYALQLLIFKREWRITPF